MASMHTRVLHVDARTPDPKTLREAAAVLRRGGLVAFPTETVYGLGADALNERAVRKIFAAKGRPADNPLIVHVASLDDVWEVAAPDERTRGLIRRLASRHWPGPLTIVAPKGDAVPAVVTGGLSTVAVRMPDHPVARGLIQAAGRPVAAPSANRSGRPSPTEAAHVLDDLAGRIDVIVDGGPATIGVESTVLDVSRSVPVVHRPGAVTVEQLTATMGRPVELRSELGDGDGTDAPPPSPGVKYEHYAPRTPCIVVEGKARDVEAALAEALAADRRGGRKTALLATEEGAAALRLGADAVCVAGSRSRPETVAQNIYRCLRRLDEVGADVIYIEGIAPVGLGVAVMNRLRRAAGHRVVRAAAPGEESPDRCFGGD